VLLEYIDASHPLLKVHLQTLSSDFLPELIEHGRRPARRLKLELISKSQIKGELASRSLGGLLEYCDDDNKERAT